VIFREAELRGPGLAPERVLLRLVYYTHNLKRTVLVGSLRSTKSLGSKYLSTVVIFREAELRGLGLAPASGLMTRLVWWLGSISVSKSVQLLYYYIADKNIIY
jgi:hypothetical protein